MSYNLQPGATQDLADAAIESAYCTICKREHDPMAECEGPDEDEVECARRRAGRLAA